MAKRATTKTKEEKAEIIGRITQYINLHLGISGYAFCTNAGLDRGYLKTFTGNPMSNVRAQIKTTYPAFNLDWALTGKGNMINEGWEGKENTVNPQTPKVLQSEMKSRSANMEAQQEDMHQLIDMLKDQLEKKDSMIEMLWEKLHVLTEKLSEMSKTCQ